MRWRVQIFYWNEGTVSGVLNKNICVADLLGRQYLFETLQISFTVNNSKNVVKSGCFKKRFQWRTPTFFRNDGDI